MHKGCEIVYLVERFLRKGRGERGTTKPTKQKKGKDAHCPDQVTKTSKKKCPQAGPTVRAAMKQF